MARLMNATPTLTVQAVTTTHSGGYNLSIEESHGQTFQAYRWHPEPKHWRTELAIDDGKETMPVRPPQHYARHSLEDGRLFLAEGKLFMSVTVSRSRVSGQAVDPCIIAFGQLEREAFAWSFATWAEPKHADNVWSKQTKNVVFFARDGGFYCTWQTSPHHVVCELDWQGNISRSWKTEAPRCSFGQPRGGTQLFEYGDKLLRFVHVVQNNPKAKQYWGYSLGAIVMESKPPFKVLAVSQHPILTGNEDYTPDCPHWKPRICIPYGAVKDGGNFRVSLGLNDCQCATVTVTGKDLNL